MAKNLSFFRGLSVAHPFVGAGDLSVVRALLDALQNPFTESEANLTYRAPAPPSAEPYRTFCGT
jgi:hypothetical protein